MSIYQNIANGPESALNAETNDEKPFQHRCIVERMLRVVGQQHHPEQVSPRGMVVVHATGWRRSIRHVIRPRPGTVTPWRFLRHRARYPRHSAGLLAEWGQSLRLSPLADK